MNPQYYVDNGDPTYSTNTPVFNIQYDGTTTLLKAWTQTVPNVPCHVKITVADFAGPYGGDRILDSAVFIKSAPPCP
jgi:hypothetical protein